jgi:hypothetical protein
MIGRGRMATSLSSWDALGTTITKGPSPGEYSSAIASQYCYTNARVSGQVCCKGLDPGDALADGKLPCANGYGPVPADVANVFLQRRSDGRIEIAGGPPLQVLSDPFRFPGDTAGAARDEESRAAAAKAKVKKKASPGTAPGSEAPPAEEGVLERYGGAILIAGAAIAAALLFLRRKASTAAPAAPSVVAPVPAASVVPTASVAPVPSTTPA